MLFVTAAGNAGSNNDNNPIYPANFDLNNVISVAAIDNQGNLATFSNYGSNSVDIAAPGKDIISAVPDNNYEYKSGTSMAAAYVSGVAALIKNNNSDLNATQIKEKIKSTAVNSSGLNGKVQEGRLLNAFYALGGQKEVNDEQNTQNESSIDEIEQTETVGVGELPENPEQYEIWKQNLALLQSQSSNITTLGYSNNKMYNDYIEYAIKNDGRYTIGTTGGNPDNLNDRYKRMLYGHPSPWSSYTTIRLNGSNYIFRPNTQYPTHNESELSTVSEHTIGNVSIKQVLKIIKSTSTDREDTVEIKYIVKNNGSSNADMGLRIMMDTMLGNNDASPFRVPGIGAVTKELELSGDNIPEYWQAFDSLTNTTVISQGTLLRNLANRPNKVQFANWSRLYNTNWGYTVNPSYNNGDSAVSVIWNTKALAPGETREYVTHYGLNEFVQDLRPPLAVSLVGDASVRTTDNGYEPNPFVVTAYVQNTGSAAASNVKATINLPRGLKLAANETETKTLGSISVSQEKQLSWSVAVEPSSVDKTLEYSVAISADNAESKIVRKSIFIPKQLNSKVVVIVPGIAATGMSITHVHEALFPWQSDEDVTHDVWLPGGFWDHDHNIPLLSCDNNGDPINDIRIQQPLDDYYGNMYRHLGDEGFSTFYFGYDWRMGCDDIAEQLETYIDGLRTRLGVDKVNIVAHSMGGLISTKYVANGNSNKVAKLITYGTPYLGSPKGLYVFETGNFAGGAIEDFVAGPEFKEIAPNLTSAYMLLPSKKYFDSNYGNTYYVRTFYDNTWPQGNDSNNVLSFNSTNSLINNREWNNNTLLVRANDFHDSFDLVSVLKSVDSYFFVGDQIGTIGKLELKYSEKGRTNTYEDSGCKDLAPVNGDKTVPLISATIGNKLNDIHSNHAFYVDEEHSQLLNNTDVMNQTVSLLNGNNTIANDSLLRRNRVDTKKLKLRIECPVDLHVYDNENNHVGPTTDNNYDEEIKSSSYYTLGETKIAFLNKNIYNVKLLGTGNGKMTYTLQEYDIDDTLIKTIRFDNIDITPETVITTNTDVDDVVVLNIDMNNDGIIESIKTPSVILDEQMSNDNESPVVSLDISGQVGTNGWYTSDVAVKVNAYDDISGINRIEYSLNESDLKIYNGTGILLSNEGNNELYVNATDNNRNTSNSVFGEFKIDKSMPIIILNVIDEQEFTLNELFTLNWSVEDSISGINDYSSSQPNGLLLDTSTVGAKTISITATDNAGNKIIKTVTYYVRYSFGGISQPINSDGSSVFKLGRTVPVKFQLKDINGDYISSAIANIYIEKISNGVQSNDVEADSTSAATTGNLFRYDVTDNQYIFNLNTKKLSSGTWKLKIVLNDGTTKEVLISLRSK